MACLALPLAATWAAPRWAQDQEMLAWLPALVPAFLLTYYRGWNGASLALAGGMGTLALVQTEVFLLRLRPPDWGVVFAVVLMLVTVALGSGWVSELLLRERERAERTALTDVLTGLPNRRHATIFLDAAWAAARRGHPLSVVLLDIDNFKVVNDTHGHGEGDRVLRVLADVLAERTRSMDLTARFGGEEFLAILRECATDEAEAFAEDVRGALSRRDFGWGRVTVSCGVASFELTMGAPDVLVASADRALYAAKEAGRDRVMRADRARAPEDAEPPAQSKPTGLADVEVLLVDDDPASLRATTRLLQRLGCRVTARSDAREAVAAVRDGAAKPGLVVTDIIMPAMSGFTLVDLVSRLVRGIPVLYISGYRREDVYWGGTPGAKSGFVAKPFTLEELAHEVRAVLELEPPAEAPGPKPPDAARSADGLDAPAPEPGGDPAVPATPGRILIVDDDEAVVRSLARVLTRAGYPRPNGISDPRRVEQAVREQPPDLVILDLHLPHLDGYEVLRKLRAIQDPADFLPVVVLTGDHDDSARRRALELGASDFLTKPVELAETVARIRNLLSMRLLHRRILQYNEELEETVDRRTADLADARTEILFRLARAAEYRDDVTGRHAARVGLLAGLLATELGMSMHERELVMRTAPLHDVGKIALPDSILKKEGALTAEEFELVKGHTTAGARILEGSRHPILEMASRIAQHHHERWDGTGYPDGLSGEGIPMEARIVAVADTFDVITHRRPYKEPLSAPAALGELADARGRQLDATVVDAFLAISDRVGPDALPALVDPADPWRDITK